MKRILIAAVVPIALTACQGETDSAAKNAAALKKWQDEHKAEWESQDRAKAEDEARAKADAARKAETTSVSGTGSAADGPATITVDSGGTPPDATAPSAPPPSPPQPPPSGGGCH